MPRLAIVLFLLAVGTTPTHGQSFSELLDRAEELAPLNSLVISHKGEIVAERYYRGMKASTAVNVKSVSKTLISPLVGIAIRDSLIEGVHQPLADLLPGYFESIEDEDHRQRILLHHVLSMTTGLEGTSFQNYGPWVSSKDWVRFALNQPEVCEPSACMTYSTGNSHLVSAILTRVSGKNLRSYARDVLFRPLGISLPGWDRDPQGNYLGGNNMALRPRDMLRFGELFFKQGRA